MGPVAAWGGPGVWPSMPGRPVRRRCNACCAPCWDADAVRDDVRGHVIEQLGIGVFLAYAAPWGRALLDRPLYLPEHS